MGWTDGMVKVVFFVGLRRSRARVGTGGVESDDRGITRELVSPSLGETESWIGVVQFIQSDGRRGPPRDVIIRWRAPEHDVGTGALPPL